MSENDSQKNDDEVFTERGLDVEESKNLQPLSNKEKNEVNSQMSTIDKEKES